LLAVFIAGAAVLIALPRPVDAVELPEPRVDPASLERARAIDRARAAEAARGLDADARALGSAFREYGRVDADDDAESVVDARARVVETFAVALRVAPEDVLRLRAWQMSTFLAEVRRWESTGLESEDLRELGGAFVRALRRSGWVDEESGRRRMKMDDAAMAALFKKRWNEVTGATGPSFAASIDEQRTLYRFLLRYPPHSAVPPGLRDAEPRFAESPAEEEARAGMIRAHLEQYRLKKIDELAALDAAYPADLARGVVLFRMGRYPAAAEKFRLHLEKSPDGPFTLRAQNYLRAALGRSRDDL
jgi:hypothetical protein